MDAKVLRFPSKGGDAPKHQHIIRQRLDALGKDIKWLAGETHISTASLYNHINGRSELLPRNFHRLLKVLGLDLNSYYGVGLYAPPQPAGHDIRH